MFMDNAKAIPIAGDEIKLLDVTGIYSTPGGLKETSYDMAHVLVRRAMKEMIKAVDMRKKRQREVMYADL